MKPFSPEADFESRAEGTRKQQEHVEHRGGSGLAYLKRLGIGEALGDRNQRILLLLIRKQAEIVPEQLRERLLTMDAFASEHLVKCLLEEMDYQEVTKQSGEGVDLIAEIKLGITSMREGIQVKRYRRRVQRKDLATLRGALHRFRAVSIDTMTRDSCRRILRALPQAPNTRGSA